MLVPPSVFNPVRNLFSKNYLVEGTHKLEKNNPKEDISKVIWMDANGQANTAGLEISRCPILKKYLNLWPKQAGGTFNINFEKNLFVINNELSETKGDFVIFDNSCSLKREVSMPETYSQAGLENPTWMGSDLFFQKFSRDSKENGKYIYSYYLLNPFDFETGDKYLKLRSDIDRLESDNSVHSISGINFNPNNPDFAAGQYCLDYGGGFYSACYRTVVVVFNKKIPMVKEVFAKSAGYLDTGWSKDNLFIRERSDLSNDTVHVIPIKNIEW